MDDQCECFCVWKGRNDNMQFSKRGNIFFLGLEGTDELPYLNLFVGEQPLLKEV